MHIKFSKSSGIISFIFEGKRYKSMLWKCGWNSIVDMKNIPKLILIPEGLS